MARQPLEAVYINPEGVYTRIHFAEIDRTTFKPQESLADSHNKGEIAFISTEGKVLASCPPDRLSWVRVNQQPARRGRKAKVN